LCVFPSYGFFCSTLLTASSSALYSQNFPIFFLIRGKSRAHLQYL